MRKTRSLPERFWPKVDKNGPLPDLCPERGPCWIWTAAILKRQRGSGGYGLVAKTGTGPMIYAHRVAYELVVGPIPAGMELDHLCNRRECVNPAHLDPCPGAVNTARGVERRSTCKRGHPREGNEYVDPKRPRARRCRACNTEKAREYRERVRARASGQP